MITYSEEMGLKLKLVSMSEMDMLISQFLKNFLNSNQACNVDQRSKFYFQMLDHQAGVFVYQIDGITNKL